MTRREAFILGVSTYCKTADLDSDDAIAFVELLMSSPESGTTLVKRARLDPEIKKLAEQLAKAGAWGWGGAGSGALTGAGWGAMLGSAVPVVGTGIGAGIGGLLGGIAGGLWGGGGGGGTGGAAAGQAAYDKVMKGFSGSGYEQDPRVIQIANEAKQKAMQSALDPQQRKDLGMAPGGKSVASGSADYSKALGGKYMSGQTGLNDAQMSQAINRANARRGAGRTYRRYLRQAGMSGVDIEGMTPQQMAAGGMSQNEIGMIQGAQKYRGQQRALAGGRGFQVLGGGFSGAPKPTGPPPAPGPAPGAAPSGGAPATTPAPVPGKPMSTTAATSGAPPAGNPVTRAAASSPRPTSLLSGPNSFVQQQAAA